jgi:cell division protein FtsI (penicillin-binding protein 3)
MRLMQLQLFEHRAFSQLAIQRQQVTRSILAPRGIIYDCHMDELASSVMVSTVVAEPCKIQDLPAAVSSLASILEMNPAELAHKMMDPARQTFVVVKRRIDPRTEARIESLNIDGVYLVDESMRVYPNRELACQTLGFVNRDGNGGAGLELQYNGELKGQEGLYSFDVDARRRSFRATVEKPPIQGHSLQLSIDKTIQYIADRELSKAVQKARAIGGTVLIMESDTGRILALSNYPQFNGNALNKNDVPFLRNRAVSAPFEPGSTFKVVVATWALELGLTHPNEIIDCRMGSITIGDHVFHDHNNYGSLSFVQIIERSSNVGAIILGLRLGKTRLYNAIKKFGFGSPTGIDLPEEHSGQLQIPDHWSDLSIGAISFGQEVGVTPIQILTAINAVANGGILVRPSIVDRIIDEKGNLVSVRTPVRFRILSPQTAEVVSKAFEGVVEQGTATKAALEGYRTAGKTGTAQKIVFDPVPETQKGQPHKRRKGHYSDSKYVASFIGFAPLPHPRITVLVQIDEPDGVHFGGEVCAPFFQSIVQEALLQLRVAPDPSLLPSKPALHLAANSPTATKPVTVPVQPTIAKKADRPLEIQKDVIRVQTGEETVLLPDFRGMAKRSVLDQCLELGILLQASGSGMAVSQSPEPGTRIPLGAKCSVTFTRGSYNVPVKTVTDSNIVAERSASSLPASARP